jgi:hypothetical protein
MKKLMIIFVILLISGCATIPPEITKAHSKELEIIEALKVSHLAMVDSFIDQKILVFENFFFSKYGPVFRANWMASFKEINNREYDEEQDFPSLYNDLVAEYQELIAPIEKIRFDLKTSITTEYTNAVSLHTTTGNWIENLKKLNDSQRKTINSTLDTIKPGLSIDAINIAVEEAITKVKAKYQL